MAEEVDQPAWVGFNFWGFEVGGPGSLVGSPGADQIWGDDGDDNIAGGQDICGGSASPCETLDRSDTGDRLHGGPGDDEIRGYAGSDLVSGGDGDDRLTGWRGSSQPEPPDAVNDVQGDAGTHACAQGEPSRDCFSDCEHFPPYVPY